jgi:FRG domain
MDFETECKDADSFITLLRASNPVWHVEDINTPCWVFRGHRDASWRLKPRAWREAAEGNPLHAMIGKLAKARVGRENKIESEKLHRALAWTHAERLVLNEFRRIGWHMGFEVDEPVSDFSMDLNYGPQVIDDTRKDPNFSPFVSCNDIGVAQHYGVPTRFLDWTFNPIFAVFFAQDDCAPALDERDLCVWALDINAIELMAETDGKVSRRLLRSIIPRRRGNDFILAQDGLLLEIEHKWALNFFGQYGEWPSLDEIVIKWDQYDTVLRQIVLPAQEIPHLRLILKREGITREKLMPTLENAARAAIRAVAEP